MSNTKKVLSFIAVVLFLILCSDIKVNSCNIATTTAETNNTVVCN